MTTIYVDFDNIVTKTRERVVQLLNSKYNLCEKVENLTDCSYKAIIDIPTTEILKIETSNEFFNGLRPKEGFLRFYSNVRNKFNVIVAIRGNKEVITKKEQWLKREVDYDIKTQSFVGDGFSKEAINMDGAFQIDGATKSFDTNAKIKILLKESWTLDYQQDYENMELLVVNNFDDIEAILNFYSDFDYETLERMS